MYEDTPDLTTPEGRLESFCRALEQTDETLFPPEYSTSDHTPFVADMRAVMTKALATPN